MKAQSKLIGWGRDMKKLLLASAAGFALISGPALAADLGTPYYKAPPPPPPAVSWTGCYIDGGVGYGLWNQDQFEESYPGLVAAGATTTDGGRGWLGRVGGGCDYQVSRFVIGAFGDYDFMDVKGTLSPVDVGGTGSLGNETESSAWYAGGRIGYLVTPSLLTYFDAGYTQTHFDQVNLSAVSFAAAITPHDIGDHTYDGWFLGGGTEYALNMDWIPIHGLFWRSEYRFAEYQSADLPIIVGATGLPGTGAIHADKYVETITSGVVWRFNFGGP
jgi:outer membrane immunogenic protein